MASLHLISSPVAPITFLNEGPYKKKMSIKTYLDRIKLFLLVNFLSANDRGCVPSGGGAEVHLAQPHGGRVQQSLGLVDESLKSSEIRTHKKMK